MAINIISLVARSQTDEVTERELVGPEHEELVGPEHEELVGPEHEATQGEASSTCMMQQSGSLCYSYT